jgi:hypothetical protein
MSSTPPADQFDELIPDTTIRRELGGISTMALWRLARNPSAIAMGFPPCIKRGDSPNSRNYRSRRLFELYKTNLMNAAVRRRNAVVEPKAQADTAT